MKLVKILPDKIQIRTDDAEFANARLNDLISVSDGEVELVTMIIAITDNDVEMQMDENAIMEELQQPSLKVIECTTLGSIVDGEFAQQIDKSIKMHKPTARNISDKEFGEMLKADAELRKNKFRIGEYSGYGISAWIDGNRFYQKHACVVGNTGCGKSETVTKILEETSILPSAKIIIFDIHGEYGNLSYADNIKMGEVPFPIWMLGFTDMVANVLKVKEDSTVVMSALRKSYYAQCPNGNEGKPEYFDFTRFSGYLLHLNNEYVGTGEFYKTGDKAGQEKKNKGDYNGKLFGILNTIESLLRDKRYTFLFDEEGSYIDKSFLKYFLNRIMGGDKL